MHENKFTEKDKEKLIEYVNFISTKAKFDDFTTQDAIKYFGMLTFIQKQLIPKVEANIFEMGEVINAPKDPESNENAGGEPPAEETGE